MVRCPSDCQHCCFTKMLFLILKKERDGGAGVRDSIKSHMFSHQQNIRLLSLPLWPRSGGQTMAAGYTAEERRCEFSADTWSGTILLLLINSHSFCHDKHISCCLSGKQLRLLLLLESNPQVNQSGQILRWIHRFLAVRSCMINWLEFCRWFGKHPRQCTE